jgi:drug/metabolite transporter (DMT)-like permease
MQGLVIGLFWGTLAAVPVLFLSGNVSFSSVPWPDIWIMIIIQSFIIGILAMVLFSYAVKLLGAAQSSAFGALTPLMALMGGVWFLGETVTPLKVFGVILVAVGVFLASGILRKIAPPSA